MQVMVIRIGPAGSAGLGNLKGVSHCKELGLSAMEIEFTHGVNMSDVLAKQVGELAKELDIALSIHAPYFINLASEDQEKIDASKKRILDSCERGNYLGAKYIVFHAAYYGKKTPKQTYSLVKTAILDMQKTINKNNWKVILAPETTGKTAQFGTFDELFKLSKETNCQFCIDFAHIYARNGGKIDYPSLFDKMKKIKHIQAHFSGINYGSKGEKNHIMTNESVAKPLMHEVVKRKLDITIIDECPSPYDGAMILKKLAER